MLNDYDKLATDYQKTATKPDKLYSTLPTILSLVGDLRGKTVLDLGCGDGFFTRALAANGATKVIGIDNSAKQIRLAVEKSEKDITYILGDIFADELPKEVGVVTAPYVIHYSENLDVLSRLIKSIYRSLKPNGLLVLTIDTPTSQKTKKFGAVKTVVGEMTDGQKMVVDLYNNEDLIVSLKTVYFKSETVERILREIGFIDVCWHKPIISKEGIDNFGQSFWAGYTESADLRYLTARKK